MKKLAYIFFGLLLLASCETNEDIVDFPVVEPKLVVNCVFTENQFFEFQISKSLSIIDNAELQYLDNATIRLYENGVLKETINTVSPQSEFYHSSFAPDLNKEYMIEVSAPSLEDISAKGKLPGLANLEYISHTITDSGGFYFPGEPYQGYLEGKITVKIHDQAQVENYYMVSIFRYDTFEIPGSIEVYKEYLYSYSDGSNPAVDYYTNRGALINDAIFDGQELEITLDFEDYQFKDKQKYFITLYHLSKDLYLYYKTISIYDDNYQNPFGNPVQLYNNIENGYGIFGGFSEKLDSFSLK
jgi:hypothetical protein